MGASVRAVPCVLALLAACGREYGDDRCSAILITLDTTRFDALGAFGGPPRLTPNLDRLAREGVCFTNARTVAPLTLPAHASMFTGLYPPRHGVRNNGPATVPQDASTVAERAQEAGFQTAGFVGAMTLDRAYGISQGFEHWTQPAADEASKAGEISVRPASDVVADARAWLSARDRERPFFMWVHLFDPHAPYAPPREFAERAGADAYLGEVAYCDAELGRLFDDLAREHLLERALLVVAGDHGEARGEHGEDTHGSFCWDATIRVPLFVRYPDLARAGERVDELASVVDVAPTLLAHMQLAPPSDADGISLLAAPLPRDRGVYFESFDGWERFGWSPLVGWCDAAGKYVHSSRPQFFEVAVDGDEQRDVVDRHAPDVARARAAIAAVHARPRLAIARREFVAGVSGHELAELGYADSDHLPLKYPDPLAADPLPAPWEHVHEYAAFAAACTLVHAGEFAAAVEELEPLVAANPRSVAALDELAHALIELDRWPRAVEVLHARARLPPERIATHRDLLRCYSELGQPALAREHTLRALELLVETHERRGECAIAERYRALYESEVGSAK